MKRKIKFVWSCSDFAHHEHKTKLGAVICGQRQRLTKRAADLLYRLAKLARLA